MISNFIVFFVSFIWSLTDQTSRLEFYQIRLPPEHREGVPESWETSGYKIFANTGEVVGFFKQTT